MRDAAMPYLQKGAKLDHEGNGLQELELPGGGIKVRTEKGGKTISQTPEMGSAVPPWSRRYLVQICCC